MKTAMQNHIADMKKIQEMVKSKNLDKDLEVTILESIEGCIENAESFLETEKEQIKNSYGAGAIDATSEEVLQVENILKYLANRNNELAEKPCFENMCRMIEINRVTQMIKSNQ